MARRVGIAPTLTRVWSPAHCLSATAVFEMGMIQPQKGAEAGHPHSAASPKPVRLVPTAPALCALSWLAAPRERDDQPQKNEHRCNTRDKGELIAGVAPAGYFTADVSVFVAHLLGSLGSCQMGALIPWIPHYKLKKSYVLIATAT